MEALDELGSVGRGVHEPSLAAGMAVYEARERVASLFHAPGAQRVVFTSNATHALNIIIAGLARPGSHAVTTAASHNSVLRPLYRQEQQGLKLDILPIRQDGSLDEEALDALFTPQTELAVLTHASNLTGDVYDIAALASICHSHGALCVVDAAQTAGVFDINMEEQGIDVLAFTGHKSLYGPQGTGGLCIAEGVDIPPYMVGGSGFRTYDKKHPSALPESLEAGTANAHGIAGLSAGIAYIEEIGLQKIKEHIDALTDRFEEGIRKIPEVMVYGGHGGVDRCGIVALSLGDEDPAVVSDTLAREYGICTRPGGHCAPLMHKALGTEGEGLVRFSFSYHNTEEEIDRAIQALAEIASEGER